MALHCYIYPKMCVSSGFSLLKRRVDQFYGVSPLKMYRVFFSAKMNYASNKRSFSAQMWC